MARIRTIKPEFWTSEQVMECSAMARLLFIGLWNFCDDAGNHPMSPKTIKALVFPGDDITAFAVEGLIGELVANRLISLYEASSKQYLHVNGWHHQKIDRPTFKHPDFVESASSDRLEDGEGSSSDDRGLTPGREGKGREVIHTHRASPSRCTSNGFQINRSWRPMPSAQVFLSRSSRARPSAGLSFTTMPRV